MVISVTHAKTSTVPDDGNSTLVQPSDWNANHALTGNLTLDGDANGTGPLSGNISLTLGNTAVTAGIYGNGTTVGQLTVDSKGRLTAAANVAISNVTINGDGNASVAPGGTGSLTLGNTAVTPGSYGSNGATPNVPQLTVDSKGRITSASNGTIGNMALQASNNVSITGGSIAGVTGNVYTLQLSAPITNLNDGQTLYFGMGATITATQSVYGVPVPLNGTITDVLLDVGVGGTLGSTETGNFSIAVNTSLTNVAANVQASALRQQYSLTGQSIAVVKGDYLQGKFVGPAYVTNPTGVGFSVTVLIKP